MKKNRGLIVFLVLLVVAAYLFFTRDSGTISGEYKDFAIKDTSSVDRIFIANQDGATADLNRNGEHWTVNGAYLARQDAIDLLLETFYRIDIIAPVANSRFETVVKQIASNGTKVEIYTDGSDEPEKVYYVGGATDNHKGTYMLLEKDGKKSSLPFVTYVPGFYGYLSTRFFTEEHDWRDRGIFRLNGSDIAKLEFDYGVEPDKSFSIEKVGNEFVVKDGKGEVIEIRDPLIIDDYLSAFQKLHYEYIDIDMEDAVRDSVLSSTPQYTVVATSSSGEKRELKTFLKPLRDKQYDINTGEELTHNLDRCSGLIDGENFVTLQYAVLDEIAVTAQDIRDNNGVNK